MRILFLAAEADPLIKVGGLGDVAGSLPRAIKALSNGSLFSTELDIRLVIPFHPAIDISSYPTMRVGKLSIPNIEGTSHAQVYLIDVNDVPVYLIKSDLFPQGAPIYSINTQLDGKKYAFFSLAALELTRLLNWQPDILHANDWHTSPAVYSLAQKKSGDPFFSGTHSLLAVHNLPYMGRGSEQGLSFFGIPPSHDSQLPDWARYFPLPMGLSTADRIVTVSPTYGQEILTPEFGCGLQDFLNERSGTISGILNGLDTELWDPNTDRWLTKQYSAHNLALRRENKKNLQNKFGLPEDPKIPLLAVVSRMDQQKGIDLAIDGLRMAVDLPWQLVILGTGDPALEAAARALEEDFANRVRAAIRFDTALSHMLYGGADMILMPSRYEPCGLAQMIAMRYGCVPIARATGGLRDTVHEASDEEGSTGFLFEGADAGQFNAALRRALSIYPQAAKWKRIQLAGMSMNFSWQQSALTYANLYQTMME